MIQSIEDLYKWAVKNGYEKKPLKIYQMDWDYYECRIDEPGEPEYNTEEDAVII